jgi:hypothetical protein
LFCSRTLLLVVALAVAPADLQAKKCQVVTGTTSAEITSEGCASPVGLCTVGTLESPLGALEGPFELMVTSLIVCDENVLCYEGVLVLEARAGTIRFADAGALDVGAGAFSDTATSVGGNGLFANRVVTLFFAGEAAGTTLHGTFSGTICK